MGRSARTDRSGARRNTPEEGLIPGRIAADTHPAADAGAVLSAATCAPPS
ncbi:MAG: hypothetical protein ACR2I3_21580 [Rhodococcus sp. (in: high G+C Gram-positive bacteria)]